MLKQEEITSPKQQIKIKNLMAIDPIDARKILITPENSSIKLDKVFKENARKLYVLYEALQSSLANLNQNNQYDLPSIEEIIRHMAIYKRSIGDRGPLPAKEELIQLASILASQKNPFIHILRKPFFTNKEIQFQTSFVAPTEDKLERVRSAYKVLIDKNINMIEALSKGNYEIDKTQMLQNSLVQANPNPRIGRIDTEFQNIYLTEKDIGKISPAISNNIRIVNQKLFENIYKPTILLGMKNKQIISLNCSDFRRKDKSIYDIVHISDSNYLKNRYTILVQSLKPNYFRQYWQKETCDSILSEYEKKNISENEYHTQIAVSLLEVLLNDTNSSNQKIQNLKYLCLEIVKLNEWQYNYDINKEKQRQQSELNKLVKVLKKANTLYHFKDKRWLIQNKQILSQIMRMKISGILACTNPHISPTEFLNNTNILYSHINIYMILRDKEITANAIKTAEKLYKKNKDIVFIRILENILQYHSENRKNLKQYIAPLYLNILDELINNSYSQLLPWWSRLFMAIFKKKLSKKKLKKLRTKLHFENKNAVAKQEKIAKTQSSLLLNKQFEKEKSEYSPMYSQTIKEDTKPSSEESSFVKNICTYLENQWKKGKYPTREILLQNSGTKKALMEKILKFVDSDAFSTRSIMPIEVHGLGTIYAPKDYLIKNRDFLIPQIIQKQKEEETYKIGDKIYFTTQQKNKNLYKSIINCLKNINYS